jgi:hypothetical protein
MELVARLSSTRRTTFTTENAENYFTAENAENAEGIVPQNASIAVTFSKG